MDQFEELAEMFDGFGIAATNTRSNDVEDGDECEISASEWGDEVEDERGVNEEMERLVASRLDVFINGSAESASEDEEVCISKKHCKCTCKTDCAAKLDDTKVEEHMFAMAELEKGEKDMCIMGALQSNRYSEDVHLRHGKRQRMRYRYAFDGQVICRETFCYLFNIGKSALSRLRSHLENDGMVPRVHGNVGRKPKHSIKYDEAKYVVDWLIWYGELNGLPMPAALHGNNETAPVLLPAKLTKLDLHKEYMQSITDDTRQLGLTSFKKVWSDCVPHIKIMTTREDVCHKCEVLRRKVADSVNEDEKLSAATSLKQHVEAALTERKLYQKTVIESQEEMRGHVRPEGPVPPLSTDFKKVHYTFDYAQCVTLPHQSSQMGPLYFLSGRKVNMFGVRVDSTSTQYNYVIDENESIGEDGKGTHGPNAVISLLHHALFRYGFGEKECILHCDNCGSQNKNLYMMAYLSWRVSVGLHDMITLLMTLPGHTKCLVDGGFGHVKRLFKRTDCDTAEHFANVINRSAATNHSVVFRKSDGEQTWTWYDWRTFLRQSYMRLNGIQKLHSFVFKSTDKDNVYVKELSTSPTIVRRIKKKRTRGDVNTYPNVLPPAGLSRDRQKYLYDNVRPFVRPRFQDAACPAPIEE